MNKRVAGIGWIITLVLILAFVYVIAFSNQLVRDWPPSYWGLFVLALAYALSLAVTGNLNPLALAVGEDNRLSLSKTQTLFWTFVVLYAFASIYAYDAHLCATPATQALCVRPATQAANPPAVNPPRVNPPAVNPPPVNPPAANPPSVNPPPVNPPPVNPPAVNPPAVNPPPANPPPSPTLGANALIPINFPGSVLLLLGFSVTSLIAAKGIASSQIAVGVRKDDRLTNPDLSLKWLVLRNDETVDLTRFQVVLWTLAAAGVFIADTQLMLGLSPAVLQTSLPDVGSALVLLMGLGQAAYIGGKLTVTAAPYIQRVSAPSAQPNAPLTVSGAGFGSTKGATSALLMQDAEIPTTSWAENQVTFSVPAARPWDSKPWGTGPTRVQLKVVSGLSASEPVPLDVILT